MKEVYKLLILIIFFALAIPMFYFSEGFLTIGGFGFMYMYLFGLGIILLGMVVFLIQPNIKRGILSAKYSIQLSMPYIWSILYSFLFWAFTMAAFRVITRGFFCVVYQIIGILVAISTLYLFGNNGIYYLLMALTISDVILIIQTISENGVMELLTEYFNLIISFTGNTGMIMKVFESTEHCFALAFFIVYFVLTIKKNKSKMPWFIISVLLFFLGLKRSVLVSTIFAIIVGAFLIRFSKKNTKKIITFIAILMGITAIVYVIAIHYGLYDWLEKTGINTMGRSWIFNEIDDWYELGIGYLGTGIGYISGSISSGTLSLIRSDGYSVAAIHNDLLQQYIELGCIGYIIWLGIFFVYRVRCFFHKQKTEDDRIHGIITAAVLITLFVTLMTDNTLYYFYTTIFSSIIIMGYRFEEYSEEIKLPGEEIS